MQESNQGGAMRSIVISDDYNEIDLKPSSLLKEYIQLTEKDVKDFLINGSGLRECVCPACQSDKIKSSFVKFGMHYKECADCHTLYISPRPSDEDIERYYEKSAARAFWRNELSKITTKKRREKIIKPRFEWIGESTQECLSSAEHFVDINTAQYGYIDELIKNRLFKRKTLINPFLKLDGIKLKPSVDVINIPLQKVQFENKVDVVSLFEVADHSTDVDALFDTIYKILRQGGLCFITAILISGFDLQTLWSAAENLYPPDRLNVFSIEGLRTLFRRHKFECLELSTPGILDVEIVAKAVQQNSQIKLPRFIRYMLQNRDEDSKKAFQKFLQANLLSSYSRILIRKK